MANGILGQSALSATTNTTVYTVPSATTASFTVSVCNQNTSAITFRLAVAASSSPATAEWIEYDTTIPSNGVLERTGIVAQATKQIVAYSSSSGVSVSVYGFETT